MDGTSWSVGELARRAGVTVRLLHHYDEIGLLVPSGRSAAGYRQYEYAELERLQRILAYRELGSGLDEIAAVLDDPGIDPVEHLRERHRQLVGEIDRLRAQLAAVEKTLAAQQAGIRLTAEEMFEVFGEHDPTQYEDEVRERWGDTAAYRQSRQRTARYGKDDWVRIQAEAAGIEQRLVAALAGGVPADGPAAMDAAQAHRQHISRYFYDCGPAMHRGLADMYVADERFRAHYEELAPGLAEYAHDAIHANADRAEG